MVVWIVVVAVDGGCGGVCAASVGIVVREAGEGSLSVFYLSRLVPGPGTKEEERMGWIGRLALGAVSAVTARGKGPVAAGVATGHIPYASG